MSTNITTNVDKNLLMLIAFLCISFIGLLIFIMTTTKKGKSNKNNNPVAKDKESIWLKLYRHFVNMPLINHLVLRTHNILYNNTLQHSKVLQERSAKITVLAIACYFISLGTIWWLVAFDWLLKSLSFILAYFFTSTIYEMLLGDDTKLLEYLIDFSDDLNDYFNLYNKIDTAIDCAKLLAPPLMQSHADKLKEAVQSRESMQLYDKNCTNIFLKLIVSTLFMTKEDGDAVIGGESKLAKNLNSIRDMISIELNKRVALRKNSLVFKLVTLTPAFTLRFMQSFVVGVFLSAREIYEGGTGFVLRCVIIIIFMVSFKFMDSMTKVDVVCGAVEQRETWLDKLLKIKIINSIVNLLCPKKGSKKRERLERMFWKAGEYTTVEKFTLHRLALTIIVMLALMVAGYSNYRMNYKFVVDNPIVDIDKVPIVFNSDGKEVDLHETYAKIIPRAVKYNKDDALMKMINQEMIRLQVGEPKYKAIIFKDLKTRVKLANNKMFFKATILFSPILGILFYSLPMIMLTSKMKRRLMGSSDEIYRLQTIISLLMYSEKVSVLVILRWLETFSDIFKVPLTKCLNSYNKGKDIALEEFKREVIESLGSKKNKNAIINKTYKPLLKIADKLLMAESVGIRQAFSSLESQQTMMQRTRERETDYMIKIKRNKANLYVMVPILSGIILYLVVPIVLSAMKEFGNIGNVLGF